MIQKLFRHGNKHRAEKYPGIYTIGMALEPLND
jgi:hypothetical protein